jgi:hypothetical protein
MWPGVVLPLPVVAGMCAWAFIVPALHAAAGRCWVVETPARAGVVQASAAAPGAQNAQIWASAS